MDNEKISSLGREAAKGSEESFIALLDIMKERLYRAAIGILGNEALALEAVSEAVYRAYKGRRKLREPQHTATWFTRILINCANDIYRKEKMLVSAEHVPENTYTDDYSHMDFDALIAVLPENLREIISLKYFSGFTVSEISEILMLPAGTVKSRLNRALNILRVEVMDEQQE